MSYEHVGEIASFTQVSCKNSHFLIKKAAFFGSVLAKSGNVNPWRLKCSNELVNSVQSAETLSTFKSLKTQVFRDHWGP